MNMIPIWPDHNDGNCQGYRITLVKLGGCDKGKSHMLAA
jgi:hypothetical protein